MAFCGFQDDILTRITRESRASLGFKQLCAQGLFMQECVTGLTLREWAYRSAFRVCPRIFYNRNYCHKKPRAFVCPRFIPYLTGQCIFWLTGCDRKCTFFLLNQKWERWNYFYSLGTTSMALELPRIEFSQSSDWSDTAWIWTCPYLLSTYSQSIYWFQIYKSTKHRKSMTCLRICVQMILQNMTWEEIASEFRLLYDPRKNAENPGKA